MVALNLLPLIDRFKGKRIVVLGDLVADEYVYGMTSRLSREAPVLVVRYMEHEFRLGGAANAAHNVQELAGRASVVGVVGEDVAGDHVIDTCRRYGIAHQGIVRAARPTNVKTRILAGGVHTTKQQVLRLDREDATPLSTTVESRLIKKLEQQAASADAILVSDYGLGMLSARVIKVVQRLAQRGHLVCVDSRFNLLAFSGVTAVTPNEPETQAATGSDLANEQKLCAAGRKLLKELKTQAVLIKRGRQGMALFRPKTPPLLIPIAGSDEVADVTGAGDTVIAIFSLALAASATFEQAACLANIAGGLSVMKAGAATVSPRELRQALGG